MSAGGVGLPDKYMSASLTIIVPAYNEEACVADSLTQIMDFARHHPASTEIIVVDDGSTDATVEKVEAVLRSVAPEDVSLRLIRHESNRGKGATVRTGFQDATGDIVLFTDADLSTPIDQASRLLEPIEASACEVVVGSRAVDPSLVERRQGLFRRRAGRLFNLAVRLLTGVPIRDTQCGFKAFRREAVATIFAQQRLDGFAFDVELLYLAVKHGLRVREVGVVWRHVDHSAVSTVRDGCRMVLDVIRIRIDDWRGRYSQPAAHDSRS